MKRNAAIVVFFISIIPAQVRAQPQPEEDNQSWNDVQLTVGVNKYIDFVSVLTMRFGKNVTRLNDGRFAIGVTLKPNKALSIQPFYWHIRARNALSRFRTEHRLNLRATYRFPFKSIGLSHRSWYEYRMRGPVKAWRYRPSLTLEKDIPEKWIPKSKLYLTEEIFYDSLLNRFSRNRFTVGVSKGITEQLGVDVYYMRQSDGTTRPGDLNVAGVSWKIKM